jgi:hypothetical protein
MTSSIYLKTQNPPKIDYTLVKEIESILVKHNLENLNITDKMGEKMLRYVAGTLQHWEKIIPATIWPEFRETKIIEVYSFYSGYLSTGGSLYFTAEKEIPEIIYKESEKNHELYNVVIPIGFLPVPIFSLLSKSIKSYLKNPRVKKIICVYDEKVKDIDLLPSDRKIETILVDKPGPAHARNTGIMESIESGITDVILADSDLHVSPSNLVQLIQCYEACNSAIACPVLESYGTTWFDQYHDINGTLNGRYLNKSGKELLFGTTSLMCINRAFFENGTLFSTDFKETAGEDIDF